MPNLEQHDDEVSEARRREGERLTLNTIGQIQQTGRQAIYKIERPAESYDEAFGAGEE